MMKLFKTIFLTLSTCLPVGTAFYFLLSTKSVFAAANVGVSIPGTSGNSFTYNSYVSAILKYSIRLGFALATLMLIYAGIKYLTSQGNQTQINDAKEIMFGAIIGFAILLLVNVILGFLGINTVTK